MWDLTWKKCGTILRLKMAQRADSTEKAQEVLDLLEDMKSERALYEPMYREIARYVLPRAGNWETSTGTRAVNPPFLYDDTAIQSLQLMANGMMGYLVSPAIRWFLFWLNSKQGAGQSAGKWEDLPGVRPWLTACEDRLYSVFSQSNFYAQVADNFLIGGSFGAPTMWCEPPETDDTPWVFFQLHPKEVYFAENEKKVVDTHVRKFRMQGAALLKVFGKDLEGENDAVIQEWRKSPRAWFNVIHAVYPREDREPDKLDPGNMAFVSRYVDEQGNLLRDGGLRRNRYLTWRWSTTSDQVYAYSPAMDAMPTIKAAQQLRRSLLEAAQLSVEPPLNIPAEMRNSLQLIPRGKNFYDNAEKIIRPIQMVGNYPVALDREKYIIEQIQDAFMTSFFLLLQRSPQRMTATEVMERQGEKASILGALIGRITSEFLDPLIDMVFEEEMRAGRMPPPPPALVEAFKLGSVKQIDTEYVGPLAVAQRRHHLSQSFGQGLSLLLPAAQALGPEVLDNVNWDAWSRLALDGVGAPGSVIRSDQEVLAMRKGRAQAQAQAQQQEMANQLIGNYKGLAKSPEQGSPGEALLKQMGGGQGGQPQ